MTEFKTPEVSGSGRMVKKTSQGDSCETPLKFTIPPSPCMKQLGYGTGVNVFLMERFSPLHGCYRSPWALKKINRRVAFGEFQNRLKFEADVLKGLNHPNIIGYRSFSKDQSGDRCLIMESGEKSLLTMIEERQENELGPFPAKDILKIAKDVAAGLDYLHSEKQYLHGDIKSANVLIKGNIGIAKLCDFGVALKLNEKGEVYENEEYVGTECWSAVEALHGGKITHKTDMFSYGLMMWEMLALNVPHIDKLQLDGDPSGDSAEELIAWEINQEKLEEEYRQSLGTRPALPNMKFDDSYLPVLEIFFACTETDPSMRPSAKQVLSALNALEAIENEVKTKDVNEEKKKGFTVA